jgi:hypothetical protein
MEPVKKKVCMVVVIMKMRIVRSLGKGGRDESCVADSEFATVHKVLISHRKAVSMCSGANSELVCRDISPGRMCCFWLR